MLHAFTRSEDCMNFRLCELRSMQYILCLQQCFFHFRDLQYGTQRTDKNNKMLIFDAFYILRLILLLLVSASIYTYIFALKMKVNLGSFSQ